jgi:hypothetical protein
VLFKFLVSEPERFPRDHGWASFSPTSAKDHFVFQERNTDPLKPLLLQILSDLGKVRVDRRGLLSASGFSSKSKLTKEVSTLHTSKGR